VTASRLFVVSRWTLVVVCATGMLGSLPTIDLTGVATLLPTAFYAAVGVVVTRRQPLNPIGWVFLGVGAVGGLIGAANAAMSLALRRGELDAWYSVVGSIASNFLWALVLSLGFVLTLLLYPHGLPSRRWRPVLWLTIASTAGIVLLGPLFPTLTIGSADSAPTIPNPLHSTPLGPTGTIAWGACLGLLTLCGLLALASCVLRFRRARGVERAQMRWLAFAGVILLIFLFLPFLNGSDLLFAVVFSLFPLACGIAILRYHLYDIDRIISRTTSYAIVTGLLLAVYGTIVISASRLLHTHSSVIIAIGTLTAAALARPALRRVQVMVDRRFDRARYDGQRTVDAFGGHLQRTIDADVVQAELVRTVRESLQPATTALWVNGGTT
jgi:hypothetical protein